MNNKQEILQDPSIQLVLSSGIPVERAPWSIEVMQSGKDYLTDKSGIRIGVESAENGKEIKLEKIKKNAYLLV